MSRPDISVAVFARDEGLRLHACVASVLRAADRAERDGRKVELVLVLHGPSPVTAEWAESFIRPPWRVLRRDDPRRPAARQAAAGGLAGRFVSFLDASDLWSRNWLAAALNAAEEGAAPSVWRPEVVLCCGDTYYDPRGYAARLQPDLARREARLSALAANPFAPSFLAPREILAGVPFPTTDESRGWTDADWWWTCNTLGEGYPHRIVPNTALYRRVRASDPPTPPGRIGPTSLAGPARPLAGAPR